MTVSRATVTKAATELATCDVLHALRGKATFHLNPTPPVPAKETAVTLPKPQPVRTITAPEPIRPEELAALHRLIAAAKGDTGQSRKAANLLLAWWNAGACGGFDFTDLWGLDADLLGPRCRPARRLPDRHRAGRSLPPLPRYLRPRRAVPRPGRAVAEGAGMMRLWINNADLPERAIVRGILAGERVLAEHGVTLAACMEALAAQARKEPPLPELAVFDAAEAAALVAA